jgi:hypothetical protein
MLLNIPTAIWFGFLTFASLITTASLGIAVHVFKKNVFNIHRFFAFTTIILAIIHFILAILLWFYGIRF